MSDGRYLITRSPASPTDWMSRPTPLTVLQAALVRTIPAAATAITILRTKGLSLQSLFDHGASGPDRAQDRAARQAAYSALLVAVGARRRWCRCSRQAITAPATMISGAPSQSEEGGTSFQISQPNSVAQTSDE